jgi:hypothetical protein
LRDDCFRNHLGSHPPTNGNLFGASSPTDGLGEYQSAGGLPECNYDVTQGTPVQAGSAGDYFAHTVNNLGLDDVTFGDTACEDVCQPLQGNSFSVGTSGFNDDIDFELQLADELFLDRFELQ